MGDRARPSTTTFNDNDEDDGPSDGVGDDAANPNYGLVLLPMDEFIGQQVLPGQTALSGGMLTSNWANDNYLQTALPDEFEGPDTPAERAAYLDELHLEILGRLREVAGIDVVDLLASSD